MIVTRKKKGETSMENKIREDIKTISNRLTDENKKYVLAVANALMFSQQCGKKSEKDNPSQKKGIVFF